MNIIIIMVIISAGLFFLIGAYINAPLLPPEFDYDDKMDDLISNIQLKEFENLKD